MSTDRTLARIDDTLDEWSGFSPDATRWAGEPEESEWPEHRWIDFPGDTSGYLLRFEPPAPEPGRVLIVRIGDYEFPVVASEAIPARSAVFVSINPARRLGEQIRAVMYQLEASTGKSWAYLVQRAQRPLSAAERTRSPRWRSGTRRTKRHARRRP